jgi:hypothetical protein
MINKIDSCASCYLNNGKTSAEKESLMMVLTKQKLPVRNTQRRQVSKKRLIRFTLIA